MDISQSARSAELGRRILEFMAAHIYPHERRFYQEAEPPRSLVRSSGGRGTQAARAVRGVVEPVPAGRGGRLQDEAAIGAEDLMRVQSVIFHGKRQRVRLDPSDLPFAIWRLDNPGGRRYGQAL